MLPFLRVLTESGWTNAATNALVGADVLGWRPTKARPARRAPQAMTAVLFVGLLNVRQRRPRRVTASYPVTLDGRYFVVRGRLWRCTNPALSNGERERLTHELMDARRAIGRLKRKGTDVSEARAAVDRAKVALGERGPAVVG